MNLLAYTPLIVLAIFILLFAAEKLFPLRQSRRGLLARLIVNGIISGLAFVVALAVGPFVLSTLNWASEKPFCLLHLGPLPEWTQFVAGFLLMDLSLYYWH